MDPTQTPLPQPPAVLTGDQMYDMIMSQIEPDLTIAGLATLAQKYQNETPDEKKARADRYTKAFAEYEKQFRQYAEKWNADLRTYKRQAIASIEAQERERENDDQLSSVESSLLQS